MVAETKYPPEARMPEAGDACDPGTRPSFGGLLRELVNEISLLFRQEIRLARAETVEKACKAGRNLASIAIGAGVALGGALALIAALCAGLYAGMLAAGVPYEVSVWAAPLVVGGVIAVIGYAMIQAGITALKKMSVTPDKTTDSIKETARWMQDKVS